MRYFARRRHLHNVCQCAQPVLAEQSFVCPASIRSGHQHHRRTVGAQDVLRGYLLSSTFVTTFGLTLLLVATRIERMHGELMTRAVKESVLSPSPSRHAPARPVNTVKKKTDEKPIQRLGLGTCVYSFGIITGTIALSSGTWTLQYLWYHAPLRWW